MSPRPTQISRYEIKGLIAHGGMGELYLARDPNTSRLVAIKLLNATLDSSEMRTRFEREAKALASLNHHSIVHIYDYGDFSGSPYIVMEYVRGETLAEKIKRRAPLSVPQKLKLMVELCTGLAHAHEAGIIHRDVKPANLMVDPDGGLKILDFGIARIAESSLTRMGTQLTQMNMQIGTPGYMSPEQINGSAVDHRTDVFAVGAVCYELLSYRVAFQGANTLEIERNVLMAQPVSPASLLPGCDPELDRIVTRALAKDRNQRFQSIVQLGDALESCRVRLGPSDEASVSSTLPPQNVEGRPTASRAETAYQRSLAVDRDGARDAARRFALEALAEDPDHAGARALLTQLEPARRPQPAGPRPPARPSTPEPPTMLNIPAPRRVPSPPAAPQPAAPPPSPAPPSAFQESSLPTMVIPPRANRPAAPVRADETFVGGRADWPAGPTPVDETVLISPRKRPAAAPAPTPTKSTLVGARANRSAPSEGKRRDGLLAGLPLLWSDWRDRRKRRQTPSKSQKPSQKASRSLATDLWNEYGRSALIVAAVLVLLLGTVALAIQFSGWIWPSGQSLTITKPDGGTISSKGIKCGTRGSDCSTTRPNGDSVELEAEADAGFAFSGFTGDCAPTGRTAMTAARTCGATFESIAAGAKTAVWTLQITAPKGGTILAAGDIQCGSLASACSADLPAGVPVQLYTVPDTGFTFVTYTEDCAPSGQTIMTQPRTCSATFTPSAVAQTQRNPPPGVPERPVRPPPVVSEPQRAGGEASQPQSPANPQTAPPVQAPSNEAPVKTAEGPVKPVITPEEHAKNEIPGLLKEYCAGFAARDPARIQQVYPGVNIKNLNEQFRQYKSLTCTIAAPPEFVELDATAGTAKVEVGMKQVIEMKSGGAPKTVELIVEAALLRPDDRSLWRIRTALHKPKPKP